MTAEIAPRAVTVGQDRALDAIRFAIGMISATAKRPLAQGIAVTGSIDQHGRVQAVGGVNDKIEGFFDVCRSRGLDGSHGVIIPAALGSLANTRRHLSPKT